MLCQLFAWSSVNLSNNSNTQQARRSANAADNALAGTVYHSLPQLPVSTDDTFLDVVFVIGPLVNGASSSNGGCPGYCSCVLHFFFNS